MNNSAHLKRLDSVVSILAQMPDGGTVSQIAPRLKPIPPMRTLQRWLSQLGQANRVVCTGNTNSIRYHVVTDCAFGGGRTAEPSANLSAAGQAIQRLLSAPVEDRPRSNYRRSWLDDYRPNEMFYLPAAVRDRLGRATASGAGANTADIERFAMMQSAFAGWLDGFPDAPAARRRGRPPQASMGAAPLARNYRTAVQWLIAKRPNVILCCDTLASLYGTIATDVVPPTDTAGALASAGEVAGLPERQLRSVLRHGVIAFPDTAYRPLSDPVQIEICLRQILSTARAIDDPFERSFFTLTHLLYLQPFAALNASIAFLAAYVPLIDVNARPPVFGSASRRDFVDGVRGVWELVRIDLLRELFVTALLDPEAKTPVGSRLGQPTSTRPVGTGQGTLSPPLPRPPQPTTPLAPPVVAAAPLRSALPSRTAPTSAAAPLRAPAPVVRPVASRPASPGATPSPPPAATPMVKPAAALTRPPMPREPLASAVIELTMLLVQSAANKRVAADFIGRAAEGQPDAREFTATMQAVLAALDESQLARFGLTPAEYRAWRKVW